MSRLPLSALRAFDAAARRLNLSQAAEELHVTHAAVSRQIKLLEEQAGKRLFERHARGLRLTPEGLRLAAGVREGLSRLEAAWAELRRLAEPDVLTLTTVPSIAARWLVPRLAQFQARHPERDIRISTSVRLADFEREAVDIGIRYGAGRWPGLHAERLFGAAVFPVCTPELAERLQTPADLAGLPLLHDDDRSAWARWLKAAGAEAEAVDARRGAVFEDRNVLLQAALAGQGVALLSEAIAWAELLGGRLICPLPLAVELDWAFYLVCAAGRVADPALAPVLDWLRAEAAATRRELAERELMPAF
ncbi:MAG: transcriptional regulator GcvA [Gammaproteobacteria bacterium]|nr:transcriptional regulator GcvA [Gammaproteobacteria bacterium]